MAHSYSHGLPSSATGALLRWWRTLVAENPSGAARADRAALRRAADLTAVACLPAYQRVYRSMDGEWQDYQKERFAAIVALLAHVKSDSSSSLPEAMSQKSEGSQRNPVSALRFQRLLEAADIESLFVGLRRTLPLIDHRVNPESLIRDLFFWGDDTRRRWAYAYEWPQKRPQN